MGCGTADAAKDATAPLRREDGWSAHHNPNLESELGPLPFRLGDLRFELVKPALPVGWGHVAFGGRECEVGGAVFGCADLEERGVFPLGEHLVAGDTEVLFEEGGPLVARYPGHVALWARVRAASASMGRPSTRANSLYPSWPESL